MFLTSSALSTKLFGRSRPVAALATILFLSLFWYGLPFDAAALRIRLLEPTGDGDMIVFGDSWSTTQVDGFTAHRESGQGKLWVETLCSEVLSACLPVAKTRMVVVLNPT